MFNHTIEIQLLELKDKFYNCEINDTEYLNGIKKILGKCFVKILPSKTATIEFMEWDKIVVIDDWNGVTYKDKK